MKSDQNCSLSVSFLTSPQLIFHGFIIPKISPRPIMTIPDYIAKWCKVAHLFMSRMIFCPAPVMP